MEKKWHFKCYFYFIV